MTVSISTELAAGLTASLGLRRGVLAMAEADRRWPELFHRYAAELIPCLPDTIVAVEHIGSTAVPGLPAKPILDVAVGVRTLDGVDVAAAALTTFGLIPRGVDRAVEFNQNFGLEIDERVRLVNTHLVRYGGPEWRHYLEFRDRLRADPAARDDYAELKRGLVAGAGLDRVGYVDAKTEFVRGMTGHGRDDPA